MYDPGYFFERELFLSNSRNNLDDVSCPKVKQVMVDILDMYEELVGYSRIYSETEDPKAYRKYKKLYRSIEKIVAKIGEHGDRPEGAGQSC